MKPCDIATREANHTQPGLLYPTSKGRLVCSIYNGHSNTTCQKESKRKQGFSCELLWLLRTAVSLTSAPEVALNLEVNSIKKQTKKTLEFSGQK